MKITGHIENNVIILDELIKLPDGIKVEIILPDDITFETSGLCGIWQDERPVEEIVDGIISTRTAGRDIAF